MTSWFFFLLPCFALLCLVVLGKGCLGQVALLGWVETEPVLKVLEGAGGVNQSMLPPGPYCNTAASCKSTIPRAAELLWKDHPGAVGSRTARGGELVHHVERAQHSSNSSENITGCYTAVGLKPPMPCSPSYHRRITNCS